MSDLLALVSGSPLGHLGVGLALGTLHACDADHVMTVTSCARADDDARAVFGYGLRWSLGHGLAVMVSGTLFAALGVGFPHLLGAAAEAGVASLLCLLGAWLIWGALRGRTPTHNGVHRRLAQVRGRHGIVALGALHGLAGAAPVIALVPLAARFDPLFTGAYLLCFSLGVVLAMSLIAALLGGASATARRCGAVLERVLNAAVGAAAVAIGARILGALLDDVGGA